MIPSLSWGLTLKNGKIVDENKPIEFTENKNSEKIALEKLTIKKLSSSKENDQLVINRKDLINEISKLQ